MSKIQTYLFLTLATVILLAWGALFHQHWQMTHAPMSEMWMPPANTADWSAFDFSFVFVMWATMMMAMMLPSALPTLFAFTKICHQRRQASYFLGLVFILGYLGVWLLFSILLTLIQRQMHWLLWLSPMMDNNSRNLAIFIFILAGVYQLLPLKNACLKYCQTPVGFLLNHWQNRADGAFKMGFHHGLACLGCCWAEMLMMFAVGVMNFTGMVLITLLIALEKLSPLGSRRTSQAGAILFLGWAAYLSIV